MDLSITARGIGRAGPDGARHRSNTGATGAHISTGSESRAAPNTTHTWPFLYIYLQNVLKFSVQRLTEETRQILHASVALLFPPWCGRWSIQKKTWRVGGRLEVEGGGGDGGTGLQKNNQRSFIVSPSIIDFHMQVYKTMTRRGRGGGQISSARNINNSCL